MTRWRTSQPSATRSKLWEASHTEIFAGGGGQSAYTIKFETDITLGQSGSMLYRRTGTSPNYARHLVGIINYGEPDENANYNAARRWTQSLHDWVATYSDFPNDTF